MLKDTTPLHSLPTIWLRSFFGFDPSSDGYIGWTLAVGRENIINKAKNGDLALIYGTDTIDTAKDQRRQALGLIEIEIERISDIDKSSKESIQRKAAKGWKDKWTFALPVKRAWKIGRRIDIKHLAQETYDPKDGQAIAAWSRALTPADVERVLRLPVTEVNVFGEAPVSIEGIKSSPFIEVFRPSRGITPSFGKRMSEYEDGAHKLYLVKFQGNTAAFIGNGPTLPPKLILVKAGMSNAPSRRQAELNSGFPPSALGRWEMLLLSADYPDGQSAKNAEDMLKNALSAKGLSRGGEFFAGLEDELKSVFYSIPGISKFFLRGK